MGFNNAFPDALAAPVFVQIGRRRYEAASLADASRMFCAARDKSGHGASRTPTPLLYDRDGRLIGHVSYNGRVWAGRPQDWQPGAKPLVESA